MIKNVKQNPLKISRALISVTDKNGIGELAFKLRASGVEIIATQGTCSLLRLFDIVCTPIAEFTNFPEIMHGRVKTLHPAIFAAILGRRDRDHDDAFEHQIKWIDLVICNLYPFAKMMQRQDFNLETALENIDIGGVALMRAAAKNFPWVACITDPDDYAPIAEEIEKKSGISLTTRKNLAIKAFATTAHYDALIHNYLNPQQFPETMIFSFKKTDELRYGENPHQSACAYQIQLPEEPNNIACAQLLNGKELSYNNIVDAECAVNCIREFAPSACVIVKHNNPCGAAVGKDINAAFQNAYDADAKSAFGGIIALNRKCSKEIAESIASMFVEIIIAPEFAQESLAILAKKTNLRVLSFPDARKQAVEKKEYKFLNGCLLVQNSNLQNAIGDKLKFVTKILPTKEDLENLHFAWKIVKYVKSNAIVIASNYATLGIGGGQTARIDALELAIKKANGKTQNSVLVSDAFFPFTDCIDISAKAGIKAIMQPGGSIRDAEVIAACDKYNIALVLTGMRCFSH